MRKISFHADKVSAAIAPGMKRARSLGLMSKKFKYGSALILAVLVAPFAVQALPAAFMADDESPQEAIPQHFDNNGNGADVQADSDEKFQAGSSEIKVESNAQSDNGNNEVDVTINGQNVPVPESGSLHKRITDDNGETIVDVDIDNGSGSSNSSSSSTTVIIDHHSSSSGNDERSSGRRQPRR